jgi:hypothetical protein
MVTKLRGFKPGETKCFSVLLKINGTAQDITGDTVTFRMKTSKSISDANATLTKAADVATRGASGYADFELTPVDTAQIDVQNYVCDVEWELAGGRKYVAFDGTIECEERVSDES